MPTKRHKKMKGGLFGFGESTTSTDSTPDMFGSIGSTLSGLGTQISEGASTAWDKTKKATDEAYNSATGSPSYTTQTTTTYAQPAPTTPYTPTFGGKKSKKSKKRSRKMRGGYSDNIAVTGLASTAASISDIKSAQPLNIVGGKRRTKKCRRGRNAKSCKRRRR
jgi:hypothetical protein